MKTARTNDWISYYLYYADDPDKLLAHTIWPFVQRLRKEGLIKQFFFIRYSDARGPHVRLRLLPMENNYRRKITRRTKTRFPEARFAAYVPETQRYGGTDGVPIAEFLFEASSLAILQLMAGENSWSYGRALASAMQMHLGMLHAFDISQAEAAALCAHIVQAAKNNLAPEISKKRFQQCFAAQRHTIAPHLMSLWNACEKNAAFEEQWFSGWRERMHQTGTALHHAIAMSKLELVESPHHDSPLWRQYESYIHMTNNRLGITSQDELLLAYMLNKSLRADPANLPHIHFLTPGIRL